MASTADHLQRFIPATALSYCLDLWQRYPFEFKIKKRRTTKAGDYCASRRTGPVITLNNDLHPLLFLVTYIHEFSHHATWLVYGANHAPHGKEWKLAFRTFMGPVMEMGIFPDDLQLHLSRHLKNPKASTFSDAALMKLFRKYDPAQSQQILVSEFRQGDVFVLKGKRFRLGALRRTRYSCTEVATGRIYLVPGDMEVDLPK
jgi:hypothetical protein